MAVRGVAHVALSVRDLDEAIEFFTGNFGFTVVPDQPDFGIRTVWLQAGADQVHLLERRDPKPDKRQHVALELDDLEATIGDLKRGGVTVERWPHTPGSGYQAFVRDPTGNGIELNQPDA